MTKVKRRAIFFDLIIVGAVLIIGYGLVVNLILHGSYSPVQTNNSNRTKIYKSSSLKMEITAPSDYEVMDNLGSIMIKSVNGVITIGKNGTNFDNLNDFILNSRNDLKDRIADRRDMVINGLDAISGKIDAQKIYFIYSNNIVYELFTGSPALFPDLDKIAQSFKYTP